MDEQTTCALHEYVENAIAHGAASEVGDYKSCNAAHDRVIAALKILRNSEDQGLSALSSVLTHDDLHVRCWVATHLLKLDETSALGTLTTLVKGKGVCAFDAEITIEEWKKGTLETP